MATVAASPRTRLRRAPQRGHHDRATIDAILDEALVCHLGFTDAAGQPFVVPTLHARVGDVVYVHGSAASRAVRTLAGGARACLTATLVDGLVLARSAFHHSVNFRSVVVLGELHDVTRAGGAPAGARGLHGAPAARALGRRRGRPTRRSSRGRGSLRSTCARRRRRSARVRPSTRRPTWRSTPGPACCRSRPWWAPRSPTTTSPPARRSPSTSPPGGRPRPAARRPGRRDRDRCPTPAPGRHRPPAVTRCE